MPLRRACLSRYDQSQMSCIAPRKSSAMRAKLQPSARSVGLPGRFFPGTPGVRCAPLSAIDRQNGE